MEKNRDTAYTSSISCVTNYKVDFQAHRSPSGNCTFQLYRVFLLRRISIYLTVNFLTLKESFFPTPGVEPGPPGWKPGILTARPCGRGRVNTTVQDNWIVPVCFHFRRAVPPPSCCGLPRLRGFLALGAGGAGCAESHRRRLGAWSGVLWPPRPLTPPRGGGPTPSPPNSPLRGSRSGPHTALPQRLWTGLVSKHRLTTFCGEIQECFEEAGCEPGSWASVSGFWSRG